MILRGGGSAELLVIRLCGVDALPIFGSQEEADLFVGACSGAAGGWRPKEAGIGEVVALLSGRSCADFERVVLDPPAEILDEAMLWLLSVDRRILLDSLLGQRGAWFEERRLVDGGDEHGQWDPTKYA